jgi:PAS domain-containing protein
MVKMGELTPKELEIHINLSPSVCFKWHNDDTWSVLYVSANVESLLGYTQEQILQDFPDYAKLIHPEDFNRVSQEFIQSQKVQHFTYQPYRLRK